MSNDIYAIEFVEETCGVELSMVALFNITRISEAEVVKFIESGAAAYSDQIVVIHKEQYLNLRSK